MPKDMKPDDQGRATHCNSLATPDEAGDAARRDETLRRMLITPKNRKSLQAASSTLRSAVNDER